ncbi:MAG: metalloregulator ArsR/SmtB family transcription factor [Kofleriaceae bacterium]
MFSVAALDVAPLSRLFRALGDETRLRIVALLAHGELCVCHLERALELSQPTVSRQLGVLRAAGLVTSRREGTWVYYKLVPQRDAQVVPIFETVSRSFGARPKLRADHARLLRSCGPTSCA